MMWNVWDLHQVRAGGQVAGVGLSNVSAAGYSRQPDSPNALRLSTQHGHYGRKNDFSQSLRGQIMQDQHPHGRHNHEQDANNNSSSSNSSYRTKAAEAVLTDEYGNAFSGAHVLARLVEAGKMLGPKSWVGLTRAFQQASLGSSSGLTRNEFAAVLEAFGLGVSPKELQLIFQSFDADNDGHISYNEFMHELRGSLTGQRHSVVDRAWERIDQYNRGRVPLADLCRAFNPLADARVKNGDISPSKAVQEFMTTFDFGDSDEWVLKNDFVEYYTSISPTIDDNGVFTLMVWNTWLGARR